MLRLVTWNIQLGRRLPVVLQGLALLPAFDVLTLQELSEHDGTVDAATIAAHLGPSWRYAQATAQTLRGQYQANGFVWDSRRLTVEHVSSIGLPTPSGRMLRLRSSRRNAAVAEVAIDHQRVRLYSVHLDVLGIAHKHAQFAYVLNDAVQRPPVSVTVVSGDMNTYGIAGRPAWRELRRLADSAGFEELTMGIGWTHAAGVRQKLDAIFASPQGLPHQRRRIVLPGSDHIPVWIEISQPPPST